jgi:hypothetical protein
VLSGWLAGWLEFESQHELTSLLDAVLATSFPLLRCASDAKDSKLLDTTTTRQWQEVLR